jgi:hypothetical protein
VVERAFVVHPDTVVVELDGRLVAFSPQTEQIYFLNETASALWRLVDGYRTLPDMLTELAHQYAVPVPEIERDVTDTLQFLEGAGLIIPGAPG